VIDSTDRISPITEPMFVELADHITVRSYAFRILADGVIDGSKTRRRIDCMVIVEESSPSEQGQAQPGAAEMPGGGGASASVPGDRFGLGAPSRQAAMPGGQAPGAAGGQTSATPTDPGTEQPGETEPPERTVKIVYWRQ